MRLALRTWSKDNKGSGRGRAAAAAAPSRFHRERATNTNTDCRCDDAVAGKQVDHAETRAGSDMS